MTKNEKINVYKPESSDTYSDKNIDNYEEIDSVLGTRKVVIPGMNDLPINWPLSIQWFNMNWWSKTWRVSFSSWNIQITWIWFKPSVISIVVSNSNGFSFWQAQVLLKGGLEERSHSLNINYSKEWELLLWTDRTWAFFRIWDNVGRLQSFDDDWFSFTSNFSATMDFICYQ